MTRSPGLPLIPATYVLVLADHAYSEVVFAASQTRVYVRFRSFEPPGQERPAAKSQLRLDRDSPHR